FHRAGRYVNTVVDDENRQIARAIARDRHKDSKSREHRSIALEGEDSLLRQGQRETETHCARITELHVVDRGIAVIDVEKDASAPARPDDCRRISTVPSEDLKRFSPVHGYPAT